MAYRMPYLIDGHNLIGQTPGISLADIDDERQLVSLLQAFSTRSGKVIWVYFDRGAPGQEPPRPQGNVHISFVSPPRTADQAILAHLRRLGAEAPNWTVVSSDREVLSAAKHAGARSMRSQHFAHELKASAPEGAAPEKPDTELSPDEIAAWQQLFESGQTED